MNKGAADNSPTTIDGSTGKPDPTPQTIHLKTADDIRLEMGKVYREMRTGRLPMEGGTKLVFVLGQLNRAIETSLIESRTDALHRVLQGKPRK